jgi:hypothetical protein
MRRVQDVTTPKNLTALLNGIHNQEAVAGFTHGFYKYPARFSPEFARAAIQTFTQPDDIVYDPFMGGGTALVEATAMGRQAIGSDISSLAVFLSRVKTTLLAESQLSGIGAWVERVVPKLSVWSPAQRAREWVEAGYQRNINTRETWRIRKIVEIALAETVFFKTDEERNFARCIVLRTAQWALDCRKDIPSVNDFRHQFCDSANAMIRAGKEYAHSVYLKKPIWRDYGEMPRACCLHRSAVGIEREPAFRHGHPIKLVLTSPPYPGVHVLYHRWQVQGRRETPAPFWIAASHDGNGASHYTFGDRKEVDLDAYYNQAMAAFSSICRISDANTIVVQMIAFSEPSWQLPRYLQTMKMAGLKEIKFSRLANSSDGRVWRSVPNRKWYASQRGSLGSSSEVVLFHRRANKCR